MARLCPPESRVAHLVGEKFGGCGCGRGLFLKDVVLDEHLAVVVLGHHRRPRRGGSDGVAAVHDGVSVELTLCLPGAYCHD